MTYKTFGYFPNYRIYGSNYQPENINWELVDIDFYAFGQVGNHQGQNIFISYDNPDTISEKCNYIKNHGLGGAGLYDLGGDCNSTLIKAISAELK
ncbi:MAG: hypothetical protein FJX70_08165 [Alphaproteobacteria bacterium]|nr:hypothetical protein [Alphaproteobacteria bacterium]